MREIIHPFFCSVLKQSYSHWSWLNHIHRLNILTQSWILEKAPFTWDQHFNRWNVSIPEQTSSRPHKRLFWQQWLPKAAQSVFHILIDACLVISLSKSLPSCFKRGFIQSRKRNNCSFLWGVLTMNWPSSLPGQHFCLSPGEKVFSSWDKCWTIPKNQILLLLKELRLLEQLPEVISENTSANKT